MLGLGSLTGIGLDHLLDGISDTDGSDLASASLTGFGLNHLLDSILGSDGGGDTSSELGGLAGQIPAFAQSSYDPFAAGLMSLNQTPQSNFSTPQGMTDFNQMAGLMAGPIPQTHARTQGRRQTPSAPNIMQDPRDFLSGAYFRGGF